MGGLVETSKRPARPAGSTGLEPPARRSRWDTDGPVAGFGRDVRSSFRSEWDMTPAGTAGRHQFC